MSSLIAPDMAAAAVLAQAEAGSVLDEDRGFLRVPLAHLLAAQHPAYGDPWGVGMIALADLYPVDGEPTGPDDHTEVCRRDNDASTDLPCRACEITRIRYLAESGWPPIDQDPHPVTFDAGVGSYVPDWCLVDGNHRVLAAWLRDDATIDLAVAGDWERAIALLLHGDDTAWYR